MMVSKQRPNMCNSLITNPLSYIYNKSIQPCVFPDRLKYLIVKPLYKNRDSSSISNYRIFLYYRFFSKLLEKSMYCRLNQRLIINNILAMEQY